MKKTVSIAKKACILVLLVCSTLAVSKIHLAAASGTIYIKADGSIDPPTAPIFTSDNVTYTFTDSITDSIVVERSNIVIDGDGFVLQGSGNGTGFSIAPDSVNVTIKNTEIKAFTVGICANETYLITISGNNVTNNTYGVYLADSHHNNIFENNLESNNLGLTLDENDNNTIYRNNIENNIEVGISFANSTANLIYGNNVTNNGEAVYLAYSSGNKFFHNNFMNSSETNVVYFGYCVNIWDDGYPSGGNHWSDYTDIDIYRGPSQNVNGSDGIGDTAYVIDESNLDHYPLMGPFGPMTMEGTNVTVFPEDFLGLIFHLIHMRGSTTASKIDTGPPPPPGRLVEQYYDIKTTALYNGTIIVRIIYDDSNMTQEDEQSLKLMQAMSLFGDFNEDFKVDILDIVEMSSVYGTHKGEQGYNAKYDVDGDGDIDILDLVTVAAHYGESISPEEGWEDITLFVDTESNLIVGEASHLSIFGVTRQH